MSYNVSGPLRSGSSTGAWFASSLLRRSVAPRVVHSIALLVQETQGEVDLMRRSSGSTVDVVASGICAGISVLFGRDLGER
jgi:hypothetical protein